LRHFDEEGNFIEQLPEEKTAPEEPVSEEPKKIIIRYTLRKSDNEKKNSSD
jgi:hypothetical protein